MKNTESLLIVLLAILAMQMVPALMQAQQEEFEGYVYIYDDNGDRTLREHSTELLLKSADTNSVETAVGNFNIKIYPNLIPNFIPVTRFMI